LVFNHGMANGWTAADIPDQSGRVAVVTGANSGLGLSVARELARRGASVVMAARDMEKGRRALEEVEKDLDGGDRTDRHSASPSRPAAATLRRLDLASLSSIEEFAAELHAEHAAGIDLLINNAGVMAPPRRVTADGFELQLGTNFLGHFALTGRVIDLLLGVAGSRVVTVSSNAHKMGRINFDDLQSERRYMRWLAYNQSKLADLSFALELDRRLRAAGAQTISVAAHPGYAATNLQTAAPPLLDRVVMRVTNMLVAQSADMGALPLLYAATQPGIEGGTYVGPDGIGEFRGHPKVVRPTRAARDQGTSARLWAEAERLTDVHFALPSAAAA
jgi:NAD(P)-dependent dehydrogenase (short-subunit alcohol dehydrogenase family)